jgi:putative FmdB family regulatory protein
MPLYEYRCAACQQRFELIRKFSDPELEVCTLCGKGPVTRLVSSPAIQFKGSGWYITDYSQKGKSGSETPGTPSAPDAKPATGDSASSSTKTDTAAPAAKPAASE